MIYSVSVPKPACLFLPGTFINKRRRNEGQGDIKNTLTISEEAGKNKQKEPKA